MNSKPNSFTLGTLWHLDRGSALETERIALRAAEVAARHYADLRRVGEQLDVWARAEQASSSMKWAATVRTVMEGRNSWNELQLAANYAAEIERSLRLRHNFSDLEFATRVFSRITRPDVTVRQGIRVPAAPGEVKGEDVEAEKARDIGLPIAMPPGRWMDALAGVVFSRRTKERVFDQIVDDFRREYIEGLHAGGSRARMFFVAARHWYGFVHAFGMEATRLLRTIRRAG